MKKLIDCLPQTTGQFYSFLTWVKSLRKLCTLDYCLYKIQFGFQNSHLTNNALDSITEEGTKALDNDGFACGVFLDFQKAFDTVNYKKLTAKLNHYGIRAIALDWFKSYLTNRM